MKQFMFFLAMVGLAATGCTHTRVLGPHARRGGADLKIVRQQPEPRSNLMKSFLAKSAKSPAKRNVEKNSVVDSKIELASYGGGRCRPCCAKPRCKETCCDDTCCDDNCCGGCCDDSCCEAPCCGCGGNCCADACCGNGCCGDECCSNGCCGACGSDGCCGADGCSACGGRGCGLCQRMVGKIACGCCPHSGGYPEAYNFNPSPPTGQVAYPYYTVRGPRDFLRNNPPSIGPY